MKSNEKEFECDFEDMKKELDKRWGDYQDGAMQVDQLKK